MDLYPGSASSQALPLGRLGSVLLMAADGGPGVGRELYRTDGTRAGTHASDPGDGVVLDGRLYFSARNAKGRELWVSDGTAAGTMGISDINPGAGDAKVQLLAKVGKRLVFFADDGLHGLEPWTYVP